MRKRLSETLTENMSYKIVALFIALILWLTILGRRDFVYTKNIDLEFKTSENISVVTQSADTVRVRVSGPRSALKKFMESSVRPITLDLLQAKSGVVDLDIPHTQVEVPLGVKILSVRPNQIRVELEELKKEE